MKYREKLISEIEFPEIDLDYPFYGPEVDNDGEEVRNEVRTPDGIWNEVESMDLDKAIAALQTLKSAGADRVYFYAHADHHSYIFTGVKLESDE